MIQTFCLCCVHSLNATGCNLLLQICQHQAIPGAQPMNTERKSEAAKWMLAPADGREENPAANFEHISRSALSKGWGLAEAWAVWGPP